jgi:hypothetical protein
MDSRPAKIAEVLRASRVDGLLVVQRGLLERHYIYSEPGQPLCCESYLSVGDLLLDLLASDFIQAAARASLGLLVNPSSSPWPELRRHIERELPHASETNQFKSLSVFMDVSDFLASKARVRFDSLLCGVMVDFADRLFFGGRLASDLMWKQRLDGRWAAAFSARDLEFRGETLLLLDAEGNRESTCRYKISRRTGRMCEIQLTPLGQSLPFKQWFVMTDDGQNLVVHDRHGRTKYARRMTS